MGQPFFGHAMHVLPWHGRLLESSLQPVFCSLKAVLQQTFQTGAGISRVALVVVMLALASVTNPTAALEFPGPSPGIATATLDDSRLVIQNEVICATWNLRRGRLGLVEVVDRLTGRTQQVKSPEAFVIELTDGDLLPAIGLWRSAGRSCCAISRTISSNDWS